MLHWGKVALTHTVRCEACGAVGFANLACLACLRWQVAEAPDSKIMRRLLAAMEKRVRGL